MSETTKKNIESAIITFVSFFILDLGTGIHALASQPFDTITWAVIWSVILSAFRAAVKSLWGWYLESKKVEIEG